MQQPLMGVEIAGYGIAVPERKLNNDQLIELCGIDSTDDKIQELSGIKQRYIVDPTKGENNASLSAASGRAALEMAGLVEPFPIDSIILATTTPDRAVPATSSRVHRLLGSPDSGAFDLNSACSGFIYALNTAYKNIATGDQASLVIGTDILSRIVDYKDRRTAILFGDASGAVVLQKTDRQEAGLLSRVEMVDGSAEDYLFCEHGGTVQMDGHEVYRTAVDRMVRVGRRALEKAELTTDDLKLIVPHQANKRIIDSVARRLGVPSDSMVWEGAGELYANTSSASIPIALAQTLETGRLNRGDKFMVVGFGAGLTAAASIICY